MATVLSAAILPGGSQGPVSARAPCLRGDYITNDNCHSIYGAFSSVNPIKSQRLTSLTPSTAGLGMDE